MTEEEKKAILYLNKYIDTDLTYESQHYSYIRMLIRLVGKQQKEIEQLANGIRVLGTNPDITTEDIIKEFTEKPISEEYMEKFKSIYISKDEVLKALGYEEGSQAYKSMDSEEKVISLIRLVNEECNRLEDIEDQKVMLEEHNIENMRDKYWQDKIRDYYHKICASVNHFESKNDNNIVLRIKKYLEELLEEN